MPVVCSTKLKDVGTSATSGRLQQGSSLSMHPDWTAADAAMVRAFQVGSCPASRPFISPITLALAYVFEACFTVFALVAWRLRFEGSSEGTDARR
jgi:hypothetical protein